MSDTPDELLQRYADAVAQDERRPAARVRDAVRAHAQMVVNQQSATASTTPLTKPRRQAANWSRWNVSLVASLAVIGLVGVLMLQIEHGPAEDREAALGGAPKLASTPPVAAPAATPAALPTEQEAPAQANAKTAAKPTPATTPAPAPTFTGAVARNTEARDAQEHLAKRAGNVLAREETQEARATASHAPSLKAMEPLQDTARAKNQLDHEAADKLVSNAPPQEEKRKSNNRVVPETADVATPATQAVAAAPMVAQAPISAALPPPPLPAPVSTGAPPAAARYSATPPAADATPAPVTAPAMAQRQRTDAPPSAALQAQFLDAVRNGQLDAMEVLLVQGALVNARDVSGNTALMVAVLNRKTQAVRKLLDKGADVRLTNPEGLNALQLAIRLNAPDIVNLLQTPR